MTSKRRVTIITEDDNTPAEKKPVTVDITPEEVSLAPRDTRITRAGDENGFDFDADEEASNETTDDIQELLNNLPRTQETWAIMGHLKSIEMDNLLTAHVIRDIFEKDLPAEHIDRLIAVTLLGDVEDIDAACGELEEDTILLFQQLQTVVDQLNETDDYNDGLQLYRANQAATCAALDVRRVLTCYYIGNIDLMTEMLESDGIMPKTEDLRFIGGLLAAMSEDGQLEDVVMASAVQDFNRLAQLAQAPLYLIGNEDATMSLIDSENDGQDFGPRGPGPKGPGF